MQPLYAIEGRQPFTPPQYLSPISAAIPAELKELRQWVLWKPVLRQGKWTKPPYQKDGRHASCADPSTWADFDAVDAAYRSGGWAGYGFVLAANDPFCGIDLDHVRDPENGAIEAWARDLIRRFNSYTEISPSGTGVRIFIKGRLPQKGRHKGKIEIYDRSRFLTVTGHAIDYKNALGIRRGHLLALLVRVFRAWLGLSAVSARVSSNTIAAYGTSGPV